jgi:Chitin binding Peritrophin-A domain
LINFSAQLPYLIFLLSLIVVTEAKSNPCSGLWLGEIVANPERCDKYYICVLTRPVPQLCEPNKIFDISTKKCVPGNRETCEFGDGTTTPVATTTTTTIPISTTPISTTTPITTTPQPPVNLEEICRDVFFAAKPYPNSLEIYVGCIRGNGVLFTCMENEFFHPVINECLKWPESTSENPGTQTVSVVIPTLPVSTSSTFFPETSREPESTTAVPETTTSRVIITTPTPLEGICDGKFFEYVQHPSNCALFIFCYDEKEFIRQCPEFTIFDIKTAT